MLVLSSAAYAQIALNNTEPAEPFEKRVNGVKNELIKNPDNANLTDRYIKALLVRADYYKKSKKNYAKAADDLRSALYFLSRDKNSDKYSMASAKLAENLTAMDYFPSNAERLELAKNLYWEDQYFAAAYELEQLAGIGYDEKTTYEFLGDIYQKINKEDQAIKYYNKSLEAYSKNGSVAYKLAEIYYKRADFALADEKYKQTIQNTDDVNILSEIIKKYELRLQQNSSDTSVYEVLALAYKKEGNYQKSYNLLKKALQINPEDITLKYELGNTLYEMKEYQLAVDTYESILAKNPYDSQIRIAKAKSLSTLGKNDDALKEYQMALVVYPDSRQAQYGIYRMFYGLPLDTIAQKFYPLKHDYKPDANLYEGLGDFAQEINEPSHAISFYKQALLKNSKTGGAYIALYNIYELENNKKEALAIIEKGYKNLPSNAEIIKILEGLNKEDTVRKKEIALSYLTNNEYKKALTIYQQINPKNSDVYLSIANCQTLLNQYKEANESLQNAIKIDPANSDLYYMLALNYINQNSIQSAKRELRKSIALNKNNLKSNKLLNSILRNEINEVLSDAEKYYYKKDYAKTLEILNAGLQKLGAQLQLFYYRGIVYHDQKKYLESLSDFKKVVELDNSYDPVYFSLGELFEDIGQEREALSAYERYLSGSPDDKNNIKKAQERVLKLEEKYY